MMMWKKITKQMMNRIALILVMWLLLTPMASLGQTPEPVAIRVVPAERTIEPDDMFAFRAIGVFADNTEQDYTDRVDWSTENRRIADVDDNGVVTGIRSGNVFIIARFGDLVNQADLRVVDVTSLRIEPAVSTIDIGESIALRAFAIFGNNGQEVPVTAAADWESSNASVASVDNAGNVVGNRAGDAMITARLGDQTAAVAITVNTAPMALDDQAETPQDTPVSVPVTANDRDPDPNGVIVLATVDLDPSTPERQTVAVVPGQGRFVGDDAGNVAFTPEPGFTGVATSTYTVEDDRGSRSNVATIAVTVTTVVENIPPVAVDDRATTDQDTPVTFSVTANDSDADGTVVPATVDLQPSALGRQTTVVVPGEGQFVADDLGNVTFAPEPDFTDASTIEYTVADNQGAVSNAAAITVTVRGGEHAASSGR